MIPADQYQQIIEVLPILCVDVVVTNAHGEYLLIRRAYEPRKGQWWVIGGRVLKGETMEQAAIRKVQEETCLEVKAVRPIGYYEELSQDNPFGLTTQYHAVSVVFSTVVSDQQEIRLDSQSTEWKYSKELPPDFRIRPFDGRQQGGR